jgi:phosphopantothenoylcysteine decarboxylase
MLTNTTATFEDIHAAFTTKLTTSRASDLAFFQSVSDQAATLSAPLPEETIETMFTRDGKRVHETFMIGERIEKFKKLLEKEEGRLGDYWKQWDEVQNEYLELGVEVFGAELFGEDGKGKGGKGERGWKRVMELAEAEHETRVGELEEEVGEIRVQFSQVMKTSEKVRRCLILVFVVILTLDF